MKINVKKIIVIVLILIMLPVNIPSIEAKEKPQLNKTSINMSTVDSIKLKVLNTSKKVIWSSSDKTIVQVNSKGVVTPCWFGEAIITAKVDGKKLECKVNVLNEDVWFNDWDETKSDMYNNFNVSIMPITKSKVRVRIFIVDEETKYHSGDMYGKLSGNKITLKDSGKYNISGTVEVVYKKGMEHSCVVRITKSDLKQLLVKKRTLTEKIENT